MDFYE
jgi:hypothetical protein